MYLAFQMRRGSQLGTCTKPVHASHLTRLLVTRFRRSSRSRARARHARWRWCRWRRCRWRRCRWRWCRPRRRWPRGSSAPSSGAGSSAPRSLIQSRAAFFCTTSQFIRSSSRGGRAHAAAIHVNVFALASRQFASYSEAPVCEPGILTQSSSCEQQASGISCITRTWIIVRPSQ